VYLVTDFALQDNAESQTHRSHSPPKRRRADEPFFDEAIPLETPEEEQSTNFHKQKTARRFLNKNKARRYDELTAITSYQKGEWN